MLPTIVCALARKFVTELPAAIGSRFVAEGITSTHTVAARDVVVLFTAFALRFFVLYPTWASLVAFETRRTSRSTDSLGDQSPSYGHVLKPCYQKVLFRLSGLHLQAAGIMISIETVTCTVAFHLLHINNFGMILDISSY